MTRNLVPDLLERGVRKTIFRAFEQTAQQYDEIYEIIESKKATETDVILSGLGLYDLKVEGNSPNFDAGQEAYKRVFRHATWAKGIEFTEEGLEDELYGFYMELAKELGSSAAYTMDIEALDLLNDLSMTLYTVGATSYPVLSTTHYLQTGDTWSNRPTTAGDLNYANLQTALSAWRTNMVDLRGRKLRPEPELLVVGASDEFHGAALLDSLKAPGGNDNDPNVVRSRRNLRLVVLDHLTDDGRWFLMARKGKNPFKWFRRRAHRVRRRDDPRTGNVMMVGSYRESHGGSTPLGVYGSP